MKKVIFEKIRNFTSGIPYKFDSQNDMKIERNILLHLKHVKKHLKEVLALLVNAWKPMIQYQFV